MTPGTTLPPAPANVIELCDVWFRYSRGPYVLEAVDFRVREGAFLGLIGPNGGGKTTLLKIILGLLRPERGTATVLGQAATALGAGRQGLGYVPQAPSVRRDFPATVLDVCLMGTYASLGWWRHPGPTHKDAACEALRQTGLAELANRRAGLLSGGQQQRLAIARALVGRPKLLLLDEPTSGLDTGGQADLFRLLERLRQTYCLTVVMIAHDVITMAQFADQLACLRQTMHWHNRTEMLSEQVLRDVYGCELNASFLEHQRHLRKIHGDHVSAKHTHAPDCTHGAQGAPADGK